MSNQCNLLKYMVQKRVLVFFFLVKIIIKIGCILLHVIIFTLSGFLCIPFHVFLGAFYFCKSLIQEDTSNQVFSLQEMLQYLFLLSHNVHHYGIERSIGSLYTSHKKPCNEEKEHLCMLCTTQNKVLYSRYIDAHHWF